MVEEQVCDQDPAERIRVHGILLCVAWQLADVSHELLVTVSREPGCVALQEV